MLELRLNLGFRNPQALDAVRQILAEAHHNESESVVMGSLTQVRYEEQLVPFNLILVDGDPPIPKTTLSISSQNVRATLVRIEEILTDCGCRSMERPGPPPVESQSAFVICDGFDGWAIFVHPSREELEG